MAEEAVPGPATRGNRTGTAGTVVALRRGDRRGHPARRPPHVPALLGKALRDRQHGGVRAPGLRAGRPGAHIRDHARRTGHPGRPGVLDGPAAWRPGVAATWRPEISRGRVPGAEHRAL